ncbi:trimeric intracellular cation channel family protein [Propionimicrobium lymphophilum]|uniref:trimeric intracellular cation channel family protein n=2 Tax=Propionimicrobium lymphophilum TaxID=33012 RepID=UPI00288B30D1|nr:trimeric intracellular cation channel family protein [Propionimicrobium lymphophilum]
MFLTVLFIIGITSEGMTGALAAGRQKMDLFGVIMIAIITALGGGSVRDVLLGHYPLTWVRHPEYLLIVSAAAIITVSISGIMKHFRVLFLVLDAIGLGVFTVFGIRVALEMGHGAIIALVGATITGIMGGVLRDLFCTRIPLVFRKELYASILPIGVGVYYIFKTQNFSDEITALATIITVVGLRLLAIYFRLSLPHFKYQDAPTSRTRRSRFWKFRERLVPPEGYVLGKLPKRKQSKPDDC